MGVVAALLRRWERRDSVGPVAEIPAAYLPLVPSGFYANQSTPEQAMSLLATASRCVSLIAESTASLPLILSEKLPDGSLREIDHPLSRLLNDSPNDVQTAFEFREGLARDVATTGNG